MSTTADDSFLDEVAKLFAQEAREWLDQIKAAMPALEASATEASRAAALATLQRALTNLGGSAATVEQPEIEQAAFALLPLLQGLKGADPGGASAALAGLRNGLAGLESAVRRLAGEGAAATPHEDVAPVQLRQLDGWAGEGQALAARLQADLPAAERLLDRLVEDGRAGSGSREGVEATLAALGGLESEAESLGARDLAVMLRGLRLFLRVATAGRVAVTPHQVLAVRARVATMRPMVDTWRQSAH